jgi:Asp-tRNA(Asn)/Glu-tRNA(Gln) amidotransferase A subunit family amidase
MLSRRRFIATSAAIAAGGAIPSLPAGGVPAASPPAGDGSTAVLPPAGRPDDALTTADLATAERVQGLEFSEDARERMLEDVQARLASLDAIRQADLPNDLPPALNLDLGLSRAPRPAPGPGWRPNISSERGRPDSDEDLAFAGIASLAAMLRGGAVTSVELTELYLDRLRRLDPTLLAVVTLTEERALAQAKRMDAELASGVDRGPLHGIPWGAKDLLAVAGYPTTWGTEPYRDQVIERDAAVVERLDEAGAILVAKLTLGELAWGDVWFGGMTRNPWNPDQGASGSSAGPGAAVAAGMVPFAIGSETYGSIVSPSTRNGITGFRPTFDRVPTRGAMALSWSMDKLGPMTRSAHDAALVFQAIRGADHPLEHPDPDFPFDPAGDLADLRVGYLASGFEAGEGASGDADREMLEVVRGLGVRLTPVELPTETPLAPLLVILEAEAAAAFDELTRTSGLDRMARQERQSWPNVFRHARHIPAVEYINANRLRTRLMRHMTALFEDVDVLLTPTFGNAGLLITNLTGHPAVVIPSGFLPVENHPDRRSPHTIMFMGPLWQDHHPLRLAHAVQQVTDFHQRRPPVR